MHDSVIREQMLPVNRTSNLIEFFRNHGQRLSNSGELPHNDLSNTVSHRDERKDLLARECQDYQMVESDINKKRVEHTYMPRPILKRKGNNDSSQRSENSVSVNFRVDCSELSIGKSSKKLRKEDVPFMERF